MTAEEDDVEQHVGYHLLWSEVNLRFLLYLLAYENLPGTLKASVVGTEEEFVGVGVLHQLIAYLLFGGYGTETAQDVVSMAELVALMTSFRVHETYLWVDLVELVCLEIFY